MPASVAIAVCSRDRPERLRRCLESLLGQAADDLVVVDSASVGSATETVARDAGVRCVRTATPGVSHARNLAMRSTTADLVAFTDDDCRAEPGWVAAVSTGFAGSGADPDRLGFVVGRVLGSGSGVPVSVLLDPTIRSYDKDDDPSHIGHGANLSISRACWESLDGFDERLGVGSSLRSAEDTDFMWRALRHDWSGRYVPDAVVTHDQWRSRRAALGTSYGYGIGAGAVRNKVHRLAGPAATKNFAAGSLAATLRQAGTDLRAGYEFGAATSLVRAAGVVVGRAKASRLTLVHGHLADR